MRACKASSTLFSRNHQVVLHRENPKHAAGTDASQILIHFTVYHSFQDHVAAVHNDVDRPVGAHAVVLQRTVAIDGIEDITAQAIVIRRDRSEEHTSEPQSLAY